MRLRTRTSALWLAGLVVALLACLGDTSPASAVLWGDAYEPNDSQWSAAPVSPPWQSGFIFSYDLEISSASDKDYFSFYAEEGDSIYVSIKAEDWGRELRAELQGPGSSTLGSASSGIVGGGISATARETGTHYVIVTPGFMAQTPSRYRLTIDAPRHYGGGGTTTTTYWLPPSTTSTTVAPGGNAFWDVSASNPYRQAIQDLFGRGIIQGYSDRSFGPNLPVWRQHFTKMIVLTLGLPVSENDLCPFGDVTIGGPATLYPDNYIAVAAARGITLGKSPGIFAPFDEITRAQVMTMAVRAAPPGVLAQPPAGYAGSIPSFSPTHSPNMRLGEFNGLTSGLVGFGSTWNPWDSASRAEVAQILFNLLQLLPGTVPPTTTTTLPPTTTTTLPPTTTTTTTTTSTTMPTTTTTQPEVRQLKELSKGFRASWYVQEWGWVSVITAFKLKNTGNVALAVEWSVAGPFMLDASGQTIAGSMRRSAGPPTLRPGETGYFVSNDVKTSGLAPSQITNVRLEPNLVPFSTLLARPVRWLAIDTIQRELGYPVAFTARVRNTTSSPAAGFSGVIVLEVGGKPIGGAGFYDGRVLTPGASMEVRATMPDVRESAILDVTTFSGLAWTDDN